MLVVEKHKHLAKRYWANVIDYLLVFIVMGVVIFTLGQPDDSGGYTLTGLKALIVPGIWFIYFPVCESLTGQTLGKKAFDLYVTDIRGESPSIIQTLLRRMLDPIELVFFGIPSLLAINHSATNQRIGDMMAGTLVIHTQTSCQFCHTDVELNKREVVKKIFQCPKCNAVNQIT